MLSDVQTARNVLSPGRLMRCPQPQWQEDPIVSTVWGGYAEKASAQPLSSREMCLKCGCYLLEAFVLYQVYGFYTEEPLAVAFGLILGCIGAILLACAASTLPGTAGSPEPAPNTPLRLLPESRPEITWPFVG